MENSKTVILKSGCGLMQEEVFYYRGSNYIRVWKVNEKWSHMKWSHTKVQLYLKLSLLLFLLSSL